jgi:hypothetical protein
MQGHVALYARDARWLRTTARRLGEAGHTYAEASSPAELHELLLRQRFDVLVLKVRDDDDAREVALGLEGIRPPSHAILLGNVAALPLTLRSRRQGTFRFVPGTVPAGDIRRLVETSINAGTSDECFAENGDYSHLEEVDLQETIERAAATVRSQATRKRQHVNTVVTGQATHVLGNPLKLRRSFGRLLELAITLAPRGAVIAVEADAREDEWVIHIRASGRGSRLRPAQVAEELSEETRTLTALSRSVREQGGMLWVELVGPAALSFCLTLPLPSHALETTS